MESSGNDQSPTAADPIESSAKFDELRIVTGGTPPGAGGDVNGTFKYIVVFVDEDDGTFSPISPVSDVITVQSGVVNLSSIPQPPGAAGDHPVSHIYIYRAYSNDNGESFTPPVA